MSKKETIEVPLELLVKISKALGANWFSGDGSRNNDDIIEADEELSEFLNKHKGMVSIAESNPEPSLAAKENIK